MRILWSKQEEEKFFAQYLELVPPEELFYVTEDGRYLAYWPKKYQGRRTTLQSRNAHIGAYTEKWCLKLFQDIAKEMGGYAVSNVISEEIGLTKQSKADLAICKTRSVFQKPEDILLLIEVKMSIVWNWEYKEENNLHKLIPIGDYQTHSGNPGLLRSDTMLKAIGKSINIRVSDIKSARIPIIVIGNTPITKNYYKKVDNLRLSGIIQGFWSINPKPLEDNKENIKHTEKKGFYRFDSYKELREKAISLIKEEQEFFASMKSRKELGKLIEIANKEPTYEGKAQKFLELIQKPENEI